MATYPPPTGTPYGFTPRSPRQVNRDQRRVQQAALRAQRDLYRQQRRALRRSSILGPLLLVAVGVAFLLVQTGRLSFEWVEGGFGHWWPLVFVISGVVLLLEWGFDYARQREGVVMGRRSIGGGVVLLLILFSGLGIGSNVWRGRESFAERFGINADNLQEFLGDKHESDQTIDQVFPANTSLSIDNPRGDINVTGVSNDNQIHVQIHKEVYSRSDSAADDKMQQLDPRIAMIGNTLTLAFPALDGGTSNLTIIVPKFASTTLSANHGDVHVSGIENSINVTANHGDVDLGDIAGPVMVHINHSGSSFAAHQVKGAVMLKGRSQDLTLSDISGAVSLEGEFYGATHLERIHNSIRFKTSRTDLQLARLEGQVDISRDSNLTADQVAGPFILSTRNRNITLENMAGDVTVTNRNGTVDLTSALPAGVVRIDNRNGSVNLTVPEHSGFQVQAETTNGEIQNDFNLPVQDNNTHSSMNGAIGAGGPRIQISTSQGDVNLHKGSSAILIPVPPVAPVAPVAPIAPVESHRKSRL